MGDLVETLPYFSAPQTFPRYERPVPALLSHAAKLVLLSYAAFIAYESLVPTGAVQSIRHMDKLIHGGAYFAFASLLAVAVPRVPLKWIFLTTFLFGGVLEIMQGMMSFGRTASFGDLVANGVGAALAVGGFVLAMKLIKRQ